MIMSPEGSRNSNVTLAPIMKGVPNKEEGRKMNGGATEKVCEMRRLINKEGFVVCTFSDESECKLDSTGAVTYTFGRGKKRLYVDQNGNRTLEELIEIEVEEEKEGKYENETLSNETKSDADNNNNNDANENEKEDKQDKGKSKGKGKSKDKAAEDKKDNNKDETETITTEDNVMLSSNDNKKKKRVIYEWKEAEIEIAPLRCIKRMDPETNAQCITREDLVMFVQYADGSTFTQHADGTRMWKDAESPLIQTLVSNTENKNENENPNRNNNNNNNNMKKDLISRFGGSRDVHIESRGYAPVTYTFFTGPVTSSLGGERSETIDIRLPQRTVLKRTRNNSTVLLRPDGTTIVLTSEGEGVIVPPEIPKARFAEDLLQGLGIGRIQTPKGVFYVDWMYSEREESTFGVDDDMNKQLINNRNNYQSSANQQHKQSQKVSLKESGGLFEVTDSEENTFTVSLEIGEASAVLCRHKGIAIDEPLPNANDNPQHNQLSDSQHSLDIDEKSNTNGETAVQQQHNGRNSNSNNGGGFDFIPPQFHPPPSNPSEPRLFVVRRDGSGYELLSDETFRKYLQCNAGDLGFVSLPEEKFNRYTSSASKSSLILNSNSEDTNNSGKFDVNMDIDTDEVCLKFLHKIRPFAPHIRPAVIPMVMQVSPFGSQVQPPSYYSKGAEDGNSSSEEALGVSFVKFRQILKERRIQLAEYEEMVQEIKIHEQRKEQRKTIEREYKEVRNTNRNEIEKYDTEDGSAPSEQSVKEALKALKEQREKKRKLEKKLMKEHMNETQQKANDISVAGADKTSNTNDSNEVKQQAKLRRFYDKSSGPLKFFFKGDQIENTKASIGKNAENHLNNNNSVSKGATEEEKLIQKRVKEMKQKKKTNSGVAKEVDLKNKDQMLETANLNDYDDSYNRENNGSFGVSAIASPMYSTPYFLNESFSRKFKIEKLLLKMFGLWKDENKYYSQESDYDEELDDYLVDAAAEIPINNKNDNNNSNTKNKRSADEIKELFSTFEGLLGLLERIYYSINASSSNKLKYDNISKKDAHNINHSIAEKRGDPTLKLVDIKKEPYRSVLGNDCLPIIIKNRDQLLTLLGFESENKDVWILLKSEGFLEEGLIAVKETLTKIFQHQNGNSSETTNNNNNNMNNINSQIDNDDNKVDQRRSTKSNNNKEKSMNSPAWYSLSKGAVVHKEHGKSFHAADYPSNSSNKNNRINSPSRNNPYNELGESMRSSSSNNNNNNSSSSSSTSKRIKTKKRPVDYDVYGHERSESDKVAYISSPRNRPSDSYEEQQQQNLPNALYRAESIPNEKYLEMESGSRTPLKTTSMAMSLNNQNLSMSNKMNFNRTSDSIYDGLGKPDEAFASWELIPDRVEFGEVLMGCTYRICIALKNVGHVKGRFRVIPPLQIPRKKDFLRVLYMPGPVVPGLTVKLEVELYCGEFGSYENTVRIETESQIFEILVTAECSASPSPEMKISSLSKNSSNNNSNNNSNDNSYRNRTTKTKSSVSIKGKKIGEKRLLSMNVPRAAVEYFTKTFGSIDPTLSNNNDKNGIENPPKKSKDQLEKSSPRMPNVSKNWHVDPQKSLTEMLQSSVNSSSSISNSDAKQYKSGQKFLPMNNNNNNSSAAAVKKVEGDHHSEIGLKKGRNRRASGGELNSPLMNVRRLTSPKVKSRRSTYVKPKS